MDLAYVEEVLQRTREVCKYKLNNKEFIGMEKDDVLQEIQIKVLKSLEKYDSNKSKLTTYLESIIENMIIDCYRKATSQKNLMLLTSVELTEDHVDNPRHKKIFASYSENGYGMADIMIDIHNHMGFNEREKIIFQMRLAEYTFNEIAAVIGCTKERVFQLWKEMKNKYINS